MTAGRAGAWIEGERNRHEQTDDGGPQQRRDEAAPPGLRRPRG